MTSKIGQTIGQANEAFVWIWLPGATKPVVAGRIQQDDEGYVFNYGASYLERENAIPIYEPELPLGRGVINPLNNLSMASCIRDGSPDAWGRRVIIKCAASPFNEDKISHLAAKAALPEKIFLDVARETVNDLHRSGSVKKMLCPCLMRLRQ